MENQNPGMPQMEPNMPQPEANVTKPEPMVKKCDTTNKSCWCSAIMALLIIVLVWWAPSWSNIVITILAVLIMLSSRNCFCKK